MPAPSNRVIVLWLPDWPVVAARRIGGSGAGPADPVAVIDRGRVFACSAAARASAVRRGLRVREAQARCPELAILGHDPAADARAFEPVLAAVEQAMPGVEPLRPGLCALRARGPARFYGGERQAVAAALECIRGLGIPAARAGVADGAFAAEQAARRAETTGPEASGMRIVPPGEAARFLAPLPIGVLEAPGLTGLLRRLGIGTLGDFARLDATLVRERFGEAGRHAHALASGDAGAVTPRIPARDFDVAVDFEPPLASLDQVAFAFRTAAERFISQLSAAGLVCTALRVGIRGESGAVSERRWLHPRWFTAADVVDRIRWQLQGSDPAGPLGSPVAGVAVGPADSDSAADHEEGLWGSGTDERIHHGLSRVQGMLGHESVVTGVLGGGRMLARRQRLVPWGDRPPSAAAERERPWPGRLFGPPPARVFDPPLPVAVSDPAGRAVRVDDRGTLSSPPALLEPGPGRRGASGAHPAARSITAWAGPWPIEERWWEADARPLQRFQVVDDAGDAWLLLLTAEGWRAEARYD